MSSVPFLFLFFFLLSCSDLFATSQSVSDAVLYSVRISYNGLSCRSSFRSPRVSCPRQLFFLASYQVMFTRFSNLFAFVSSISSSISIFLKSISFPESSTVIALVCCSIYLEFAFISRRIILMSVNCRRK